ncbi:MAG: branched-chain amino acid ABC transporter permease [Armatimonadota bacterium]|nr:branched-chain amino acid ABC transporter permease [Armatimonadota bacterium]
MVGKLSMPKRQIWPFPVAVVIIAILPWVLKGNYYASILIFIGIHTILALGLNMLMGYAGQVSLGHAAFYGIGAYTSAILSSTLKWSPWFGLLGAVIITGFVSYVIGKPTLKLRGHYLAMATLGFGIIVRIFFVEYYPLTGGTSGLVGLPPLSIAGIEFVSDRQYYYLVWFFVLLLIWLSYNVVDSRVGRALRAVHGSEIAAACSGIDTAKYKVQVFVLSGIYSGLAGALYAHYIRFVNPDPFGFMFSIELVVMVVVGGMASIWGSIAGAGTVTLLSQLLRHFEDYEIIVFGLILIIVMVYMPAGLAKTSVDALSRLKSAFMQKTAEEQ